MQSAYNFHVTEADAQNGSNWFSRTFDPGGADMVYNAQQSALTRQFNMTEAQKQRDFEELMSNTAYQRATEDMRKAGLNPYLAYSNGGASTPTGASASQSSSPTANSGNNGKVFGNLVKSALEIASSIVGVASGVPVPKATFGFGKK